MQLCGGWGGLGNCGGGAAVRPLYLFGSWWYRLVVMGRLRRLDQDESRARLKTAFKCFIEEQASYLGHDVGCHCAPLLYNLKDYA